MITTDDIVKKQEKLNKAGKHNQEINREHLVELSKFYEHIALYSAGAISLSITFVGYILSGNGSVLRKEFLGINLSYFLYLSWAAFLISFISALLTKKYNAYYMSAFGMANYTKHYLDYSNAEIELLENKPTDLILQSGSLDENLKMVRSNSEKIKKAHDHNSSKEKTYYKQNKTFKMVSEFSLLVGIVSLVIFSILVTHALINNLPTK